MATYIQSSPSMTGGTKPETASVFIRGDEWGIDNVLENFIVQNETITEETITDTTQDQKGAVVSQLDYDKHWTLTLDLIGDKNQGDALLSATVGDVNFTYADAVWKVNSVTYTGTYNDKKKWSITAERWVNFPNFG